MSSRPVVTITQPYITTYRLPLFEQLRRDLDSAGIDLQVAHGQPWGEFVSRNDSVTASFGTSMKVRRFSYRQWHIQQRATRRLARSSAVFVTELASTNLDTYARALGATPLILWGHAMPAVTDESIVRRSMEAWLIRRAEHVFVYTPAGKALLVNNGLRRDRVTVVSNSTDTTTLTTKTEALTEREVADFALSHDLDLDNTACFVGALDPTKRIDLLLDAAARVAARNPRFRMVIAGSGVLREQLDWVASSRPELCLLPYADQQLLSLIGRVSKLMVMPGRIGLVAVDAMALKLPVITTDWPYHAPEREYLTNDFCDIVPQDAEAIARQITQRLADRDWLYHASAAAGAAAGDLSIERMSSRMSEVIVRAAQL